MVGRRRLQAGLVALLTAVAAGSWVGLAHSGSTDRIAAGYGWPVKPFDQPHPIRSTSGDPRTLFKGPPTQETLDEGSGSFSFHQGVDIVAPDGTPVYAVRSGVARLSGGRTVIVTSEDGSGWQYWHIVPEVKTGDRVTAHETVLGRIRIAYGHVHFAELSHGRPVNPLAPGHLTPYADRTMPAAGPIELRRPGTTHRLLPILVRGRVDVVVSARDQPEPQAPGIWAGMPTAPAQVSWHVERAGDGRIVLADRVSFDVRRELPPNPSFWHFYARGTRQNMSTFKQHRYWRDEGSFVFRLGTVNTHRLPDGIYVLVATARDVAGNATSARLTFLVWNRPGWPLPTPQA
jgi:hypothetical protein